MSTMGTSESKDSRPKQQQHQLPPPAQQYQQPAAQPSQNGGGPSNDGDAPAASAVVGGSVGGGSSYGESYYSLGSTGGWIAETDQRIIASGTVPNGYSTAPNVPAGTITKGCEPCVNPPKGPTGMNLFKAMRSEWLTQTVNPPPPMTIDDVDPDDIADAIEDTPGDFLEPAVHLPVMLDILIDIWEDSGLYD